MEVYKRANSPSWYVDLVRPGTGERLRESLRFSGSKVEAQKRAAKRQRELETQAEQMADGKFPTTVGEALERYVANLEGKRLSSAKNQRYRLGKMASDLLALPLHDLTPARMEALVQTRRAAGKAPQTIKHDLSLLRAATRYAAELGFRTPNVMVKGEVANPWRVPEVPQKTRYLSVDEYQKVYALLDPTRHHRASQDTQDLLVALAYTGGRWSEVAGLTWQQIDLDKRVIRLWGNKTEQERMVPISEPLATVLERRKRSQDWREMPTREPVSLVFPGPKGALRKAPSDAIAKAMDDAGLNDVTSVSKYGKATVHSLRHTFASWLIQNGADLSEVKDVLGHSSVTTTTRYAHLSVTKAMSKLGGILNQVGIQRESGRGRDGASEAPRQDD